MFTGKQEQDTGRLVTGENLAILAGSAILAIGYDILIAQPYVGVSYPVFIFIMLSVVYGNARKMLVKEWSFGWFLLFPLIALALTRLFFTNEVFRCINSIAVPILLVAHILLVTGNNSREWFCFGFLKEICGHLIVSPLRHVRKPFVLIGALARRENDIGSRSVWRKVILGIIFSFPFLIVVLVLLASADPVFSFYISYFLQEISIEEVVKHALLIGLITPMAFSFIWQLSLGTEPAPDTAGTRKLDAIVVISGLCVLSSVYLIFCSIQFSYLFGSFSNVLPSGLSYADYARRGFFELVAVALINAGIVLGVIRFTVTPGHRAALTLQWLNSLLIFSTFVMLFSAHFRMTLYEESYGYTYLRFFTHSFMAMIFVMLCVTGYKVWRAGINLAKWYIVIGLAAYVLINYVNVDTLIARKNMERFYRTGVIDVCYMAGLSYDALPYLAELTKASDPLIQQTAREQIILKSLKTFDSSNWQGYNLSEQRARDTLQGLSAQQF
ncbi:DUF4153 domain-containing protein [Acetonema longum]|uniref:Uncharacterized protein n=1 Tax=Acetonema longum DSM 6540 TaxID=1009370 RepID=F7NJP5_9FIRM|nr:DUF4173 domain-containing protein [Acetonema longum]EGO63701.1 hypothetical protein ALO_11514 [Acetonema longum DSM 6540]